MLLVFGQVGDGRMLLQNRSQVDWTEVGAVFQVVLSNVKKRGKEWRMLLLRQSHAPNAINFLVCMLDRRTINGRCDCEMKVAG